MNLIKSKKISISIAFFCALAQVFCPFCLAGSSAERIVTLAPSVTETVYALGRGDSILAVSRQCDYPPEVKKKKRVGDMVSPSLEMIVTLRPDLVILTDDGNPKSIWERLQELNIPTYVYRPRRLMELGPEIRRLGIALKATDKAGVVASRLEREIGKYAYGKKKNREKRAIFILQINPIIVAGPRTAIGDAMDLLGLKNIVSPAGMAYPTLSREQIASFNPEVIFFGHEVPKGEILKWREIEAVSRGYVTFVGPTLYRMSPRIVEGIKEMADFIRTLP